MPVIEITDYDRRVYEEKLADFLPDRFIDCHTHIWRKGTRKVGDKGCVTWTATVAPWQTYDELAESYRRFFPGKQVTPVVMASPSCYLDIGNSYALEEAKAHGLPAYYCTNWDSDEEEILGALKNGFVGIKPYENNSPSWIPAADVRIFDFLTPRQLELMDRIGGIIMLHIPRALRLRDPINLHQMMEIDEKYPNAKVVIAHIGRAYVPEDLGNAFDTLKNSKHLYFDFSANCSKDAMEALFTNIGTERIMFGSDMPFTCMRMYRIDDGGKYVNVVPRGLYGGVDSDPHMRESDEKNITTFMYEELLALRATAEKLGLDRADIEKIMHGNAARLFGID